MSTKGFVGIKQGKTISGYSLYSDAYYEQKGEEIVNLYFSGKDIFSAVEDKDEREIEGDGFLTNGLFCEFGYVHNLDNDTLEVYRGWFKKPQWTKKHCKCEDGARYTHLVFVIDKKKHTKNQVFEAFELFNKNENPRLKYPERRAFLKRKNNK
ncbi:MAG: hypothetical protein WC438_02790 [Candidatus Pacearchaeota archaeon]